MERGGGEAGGPIKQVKREEEEERSRLAQLATFYPCARLISSSIFKDPFKST